MSNPCAINNLGADFEAAFAGDLAAGGHHGDDDDYASAGDRDSEFGDDAEDSIDSAYSDGVDDERVGRAIVAGSTADMERQIARKSIAEAFQRTEIASVLEKNVETLQQLALAIAAIQNEPAKRAAYLNKLIPNTLKSDYRQIKVHFYLEGSLKELAVDAGKRVLKLDPNFRGFDLPEHLKEAARSSEHMLRSITALERRNDFPVKLVLNSDMLKANTQPGYATAQGVSGLLILNEKERTDQPVLLVETDAGNFSKEFMERFPSWTPNNIDAGIGHSTLYPVSHVAPHHPVISKINEAREANKLPLITPAEINKKTNFYDLDTVEVKKAQEALREVIDKNLEHRNLYNIQFKLDRGVLSQAPTKTVGKRAEWMDAAQLIANTSRAKEGSQSRIDAALDEKRSLSIAMLFEFRNI